ncbi:MAG: biotin--[acetyl-CoA-carboxylase] ligase [Pseudomonadota bacterium]
MTASRSGHRLEPLQGESISRGCRAELGALAPDLRVLDEVDSTSSEAARWRGALAADDGRAVAVVADQQNTGRGRRGRSWRTAPGSAIHLSLARPVRTTHGLAPLGLACAIAVYEVLAAQGAEHLAIKWPNDIVCTSAGDRPYGKIGGLLLEASQRAGAQGDGVHEVVVGLGLNLHLPSALRAALETETEYAVADLCALGLDPRARNALIVRLIVALSAALVQFEALGFAAFRDRWPPVDMLRGREVVVSGTDGRLQRGVAGGIDIDGALCVHLDDMPAPLRVHAGEVSVRPLP